MDILDAEQIRHWLPFPLLIDTLRAMFREGCEVPMRHHHTISVPGEDDATLLLMPAWQPGQFLGVKTLTVFPGNGLRGQPTVNGTYQLCHGGTGKPLALLDCSELTARRTAAASALAADYLARPDSRRLLMVGTGRLSLNLIAAHCAVRPIKQVKVWGRDYGKAQKISANAAQLGIEVLATDDLEQACRNADIVTTATLAKEPLVHGAWLRAGAHLDLVGGFTPERREADDACVQRAQVFVDTRQGALQEAGDIVVPLQNGVLREDEILADLFDLSRGIHPGRRSDHEITLFKSVGTALEDLAAAILAYKQSTGSVSEKA